MLTVIIAPEKAVDSFERYKMFTDALFREYNIALCKCDYEARDLQNMTPDLYGLIADCDTWRAVIVAPERREFLNPFDYTGYVEDSRTPIAKRREQRFSNYEKAVQNPLLQLTTALCGAAFSKLLMDAADYEALTSGRLSTASYLLKRRLRDINVKREAYRMRNARDGRLEHLVGAERYDEVVGWIEQRDCEALSGLLDDEKLIELIRLIGGEDPRYTDPEMVENDVCNYKKYLVLSSLEQGFLLLDKKPAEVRCVALRCFDTETYYNSVRHKPTALSTYSGFAENNLYAPSLQFFVYDIMNRDDKRYHMAYLKFLSFLLVFAANDIPRGAVSGGFLYRVECNYNDGGFEEICQRYLNKLCATRARLENQIHDISQIRGQQLDDFLAEQTFEAPVVVPVSIRSSRSKDDLKAKSQIGLSRDCPQDEEGSWEHQRKSIAKNLVRYLREPRRAVKTAAKGPFRELNAVSDERILNLNEYQMEDIVFKLEEEERRMVETSTSHIFDTEEYNRKMDEAGKKVTDRITKRMTRRKVFAVSAVAAGVYLIGFLPLFISQLNTVGTVGTSLMLISACMGSLFCSGLVTLFVFRHELKKLINEFNRLMSGIGREIDDSLGIFSEYLSHACNVMRKFSVINYDKHPQNDAIAVLKKHKFDVEKRIRMLTDRYAPYLDTANVDLKAEPYLYDYSRMTDYDYPPDEGNVLQPVTFITQNNSTDVPVGYLYSIIAVKEDLYD